MLIYLLVSFYIGLCFSPEIPVPVPVDSRCFEAGVFNEDIGDDDLDCQNDLYLNWSKQR